MLPVSPPLLDASTDSTDDLASTDVIPKCSFVIV